MTRGVPELEEAVRGAIRPSWAEIVRAKKAIRELLADGEPYGIRKIQGCLLEADGVPLEPVRGDRLQLTSPKDIPAVVRASHPLIARPRLALAATEALLDLLSLGIIVEVAKSPQPEGRNPIVGSDVIHVSYEMRGYGSSVRSPTWLPDLAPAYRLAPRLRQEATQWFFDADLFTADLEHLDLDSRSRRCIVEALTAYRNSLYLACANLLGAASEGSWYAAGEKLSHLDEPLGKAIDSDDTARVIKRVADVLRQHGRLKITVDELLAQASLLRQLRNYGAHPRGNETDHLERYFSESGGAILLMETYTYLTRLADAVESRLEVAQSEDK